MATTAATFIRQHGASVFETRHAPGVPIPKQLNDFRKLARSREHPTFAEVQLWMSHSGVTKTLKLRPLKSREKGSRPAGAPHVEGARKEPVPEPTPAPPATPAAQEPAQEPAPAPSAKPEPTPEPAPATPATPATPETKPPGPAPQSRRGKQPAASA